ncbi:MAG: glycine cleavage system protein GcvH [Chloroflexia bacterium]|jgi:glycine cleavage system H protein|nr:glycine cleavage system protein GcvH [Chloroflexia bacterium]
MKAPANLKFTKSHEWVLVEDNIVTIGIADYAQQELGDITYLELPEVGASVSAGEPFAVVESVKAAADIYAPLDGEVLERNESAVDSPEVINTSPYGEAWLVKIQVSEPAQVDGLMSATDYDTFAEALAH